MEQSFQQRLNGLEKVCSTPTCFGNVILWGWISQNKVMPVLVTLAEHEAFSLCHDRLWVCHLLILLCQIFQKQETFDYQASVTLYLWTQHPNHMELFSCTWLCPALLGQDLQLQASNCDSSAVFKCERCQIRVNVPKLWISHYKPANNQWYFLLFSCFKEKIGGNIVVQEERSKQWSDLCHSDFSASFNLRVLWV